MSGSDRRKTVIVNEPDARWIVIPGPRNGDSDWFNITVFDLVAGRGKKRRIYSLGHNTKRFAKSSELDALNERHPEVVPVIEAALFAESQGGNSNQGDRP